MNDNGDARFTNFMIQPATGRRGTTFTMDLIFVSLNGTGTGELTVEIDCPDEVTIRDVFLAEEKKSGSYNERITLKAERDPQCDPSQSERPTEHPVVRIFILAICDERIPGTYNVKVQICNGECGSHHPHSAIYDTIKGSFVRTK